VTSSASPPKTLRDGRYVLLHVLGEGSQAETYEARDTTLDPTPKSARPNPEELLQDWNRYVSRARSGKERPRPDSVAIKCFRIGKAKAWKDVELAEREAKTLASVDHPNLPRYIEHFEEDGVLYLVMEKIEGESLAAIRKGARKSFGVEDVGRMLADVGDALSYLHGRAPYIVHRDVKPGNILRRPDGSYALVDFGAVRDRLKPAGGSTIVGTFGYMAPEQFQGRASPKSDIYALGVTAITLLTGCEPEDLPHEGLGIDVARALPRGTPARLIRALTKMVEPDPDRRAGSIEEVRALLATSARGRDEKPRPERKADRRRREQEERKTSKRARHAERHRRRALARARGLPFVPRSFAKLGLFVAFLVVWLTVGIVVPLLLYILSILFGQGLRRAAQACTNAAVRSSAALGRASSWVSGERALEDGQAQIRVAEDGPRVRAATDASEELEEFEEHDAKRRRSIPHR
jgi:serine/threonine protein kinase